MKLSKIALAVAGVALTAPAFAINADATAQVKVYLSGATAQDNGVLEAAIKMCKAGTLTAYTASNQFVYYCNADGTKIAVADNAKLAIHKHSAGGSGNGVGPINAGSALPFLDLALIAGGSGGCPAPVAATSPSGQAYQLSACTGSPTSNAVAKIGISDVEPSFFGGPSAYNTLTAEPLATVIFGIPVTKIVYEALQTKQKADGTIPAGCAIGDLTDTCMPSLSTGQITSLYTQAGQTWAGVTGIAPLADDLVYVARRADSSGTQKTYEAVIARTINGNPAGKSCQVNVDGFVSGPEAANNTVANTLCGAGEVIVNNSGSGQVAACLNIHQDNLRGAIGTLTTETPTSVGGKFRFVKANGLAPTIANVNIGAYTFYGDASLNVKGPLAGADLAFYTALKAQFAVLPVAQPFGNAGLQLLDVVTGAGTGNPYNRIVGGELNNCQQGRLSF